MAIPHVSLAGQVSTSIPTLPPLLVFVTTEREIARERMPLGNYPRHRVAIMCPSNYFGGVQYNPNALVFFGADVEPFEVGVPAWRVVNDDAPKPPNCDGALLAIAWFWRWELARASRRQVSIDIRSSARVGGNPFCPVEPPPYTPASPSITSPMALAATMHQAEILRRAEGRCDPATLQRVMKTFWEKELSAAQRKLFEDLAEDAEFWFMVERGAR